MERGEDLMDIESILSSAAEEFTAPVVEDVVVDDETGIEEDEFLQDDDEEIEEDTGASEVEDTPPVSAEEDKAHKAFERMRKENQELFDKTRALTKYEEVIQKMAKASGMPVDEVISFYENKLLEEEATKSGVSKEVLELQQRLENIESEKVREQFDTRMGKVVTDLGLGEDEVVDFFSQCKAANIDLFKVNDIAAVYKGFNFEKVLEAETRKKEQERLANKKKRMEGTGIQHTGQQSDATYDVDADVQATLRKLGVIKA